MVYKSHRMRALRQETVCMHWEWCSRHKLLLIRRREWWLDCPWMSKKCECRLIDRPWLKTRNLKLCNWASRRQPRINRGSYRLGRLRHGTVLGCWLARGWWQGRMRGSLAKCSEVLSWKKHCVFRHCHRLVLDWCLADLRL